MRRYVIPSLIIVLLAATSVVALPPKGGNGVYEIEVNKNVALRCGRWTAKTAELHGLGPGMDVISSQGGPKTSYTTLHSYLTGADYVTGLTLGCTGLCELASPVVENVFNGDTKVGLRFIWTFHENDEGPTIELIQEIVVEGPVDGTQDETNTVIRETHRVTNLGPGRFLFGLRKFWDTSIGSDGEIRDNGPWFGDCAQPGAACDRSMNLSKTENILGAYPRNLFLTDGPGESVCPGGLRPNEEACDAEPRYFVTATARPPTMLFPRPRPPQLMQVNSWSALYGECWVPELDEEVECGSFDDDFTIDESALGYFYGLNAASAIKLLPGQSTGFTQYLAATAEGCPDILIAPDPAAP